MEKNEQKANMKEEKTEKEKLKEEIKEVKPAVNTSVKQEDKAGKKEEETSPGLVKLEKKPAREKKKKTEAVVTAEGIPISTKHSAAICRFIKNKNIEKAINDLEMVLHLKKAVPMKGEIPHRRGKGMMSGRFPRKASENFIKLLKSLNANSSYNGLTNPVIVEAVANIGIRPYGRFGAVRKKRTNIKIVARDLEVKK